jgi:hypothetical protein
VKTASCGSCGGSGLSRRHAGLCDDCAGVGTWPVYERASLVLDTPAGECTTKYPCGCIAVAKWSANGSNPSNTEVRCVAHNTGPIGGR